MRFPDGAVRPAYNAQIAAAPKEGVIVSIAVTDRRNDAGLAGPMVDDIARRYGKTPDRLLVDTSYATGEDIVALAAHAGGPVEVYTPPPSERDNVKLASLARRRRKREKEPACLRAWRERMASEAGQAVYAWRKRIGADQRRPQEPWLRFSPSSRSDQGEGPCALARPRQQPHGRPTLEGQRRLAPAPFGGRAAPKERLTRTGLIHDAAHSSIAVR
jgi:Transposase DDE domain